MGNQSNTASSENREALRESEELFRTSFEQAAVGMAQAGPPSERWIQVNDRFCEIVGYSREELLATTPEAITYPEDRELDSIQAEEVWSGRLRSATREKRYVRKDGSPIWVQRTISVVRGASGGAIRFLVVVEDISERKEAQRRLQATEERYRLLFENASEGIAIFRVERDAWGGVADILLEDANPAQQSIAHRSREEMVGQRLSYVRDTVGPMRPYVEEVAAVIQHGRAGQFEVHLGTTDTYYAAWVYPLETDMWAAMTVDVTAIRRAQAELKRRDEEIRQAYEDVLDAVTGGKLALMTPEEIEQSLGEPMSPEFAIASPSELGSARENVRRVLGPSAPSLAGSMRVMNPFGEALNNALKHAGAGRYRVYRAGRTIQLEVSDSGPGIDFRSLPKATLVPGFSSTSTLGVGFTIMLQLADRVLLATEPGRTTIVLEVTPEHGDEPVREVSDGAANSQSR